jgi:hypothetical protein
MTDNQVRVNVAMADAIEVLATDLAGENSRLDISPTSGERIASRWLKDAAATIRSLLGLVNRQQEEINRMLSQKAAAKPEPEDVTQAP